MTGQRQLLSKDAAHAAVYRIHDRLEWRHTWGDRSRSSERERVLCDVWLYYQYYHECGGIDDVVGHQLANPSTDFLDSLLLIGARRDALNLKRALALFPDGIDFTGPGEHFDKFVAKVVQLTGEEYLSTYLAKQPPLDPAIQNERDNAGVLQLAVDYWISSAPAEVEVNVASVRTAADLLVAISSALGLPGSFGNSLAKFFDAAAELSTVPRRVVLRGWNEVPAKLLPDLKELRNQWLEVNQEFPELACDLSLT